MFEHGIHEHGQLAHAGREGDLGGFALAAQALVTFLPYPYVEANGDSDVTKFMHFAGNPNSRWQRLKRLPVFRLRLDEYLHPSTRPRSATPRRTAATMLSMARWYRR